MNYQRIHDQIISRAKSENRCKGKGIYYESHHIVPVCMGGQGKRYQWKTHNNLVLLTAKEHFLVHLLLCNIYPNHRGIISSFWGMINQRSSDHQRHKISVNSRIYQESKLTFVKSISGEASLNKLEKNRQKIKESLNKTETKKILSIRNVESWKDQAVREKRSLGISKSWTADRKEKFSLSRRGDNHPSRKNGKKSSEYKGARPVDQYTKDMIFVKSWDCIKDAYKSLNLAGGSGIIAVCLGKRPYAGGFIWKYKNNKK